MNVRNPRLWIAFLSLTAVITIGLVDLGRRAAPGPMTAVHARVEELVGSSGCAECHGGWRQSMAEACNTCHGVIGQQLSSGSGLHGALGEEQGLRCARCHSEHHGSDFAIVNRQSFAAAGVPRQDEFEHAMIGFPMAGVHLELGCEECHANASVSLLAQGETRFLGLDQDCSTCHEDAHAGAMAVGCAQCHGQQAFDALASRDHDVYLPLVGGHGQLDCRSCHAEREPHSLESLGGGALHGLAGGAEALGARTCTACHTSPHRPEFLSGVSEVLGTPKDSGCASCHLPEHVDFRGEPIQVPPLWHAASGFRLDAPHDELECAQCHGTSAFSRNFPGRHQDDCAACHDDPHGGQFDGTLSLGGCLACHAREHFEPPDFGLEEHAQTGFPLTGTHVDTDCRRCHQVPRPGAARQFQRTPSSCESCHEDAHGGFFEHFGAAIEDCSTCHSDVSFAELPRGGFEHGKWADFEIDGAHDQGGCQSCHPRSPRPDRLGRTFGRVKEHFGTFRGCVTCHPDPHDGEFDQGHHPGQMGGRVGCARCHVTSSFRSFPAGFHHGVWTGFAIRGAHAEIGCSPCHEPLRPPAENGRSWERAFGSGCNDCHENPHAGQFRLDGRTDCTRCHTSDSDSLLHFEHERDSRFPLGAAHADLACSACHKPWSLENGLEVVRYRPMGIECVDCHGSKDGGR